MKFVKPSWNCMGFPRAARKRSRPCGAPCIPASAITSQSISMMPDLELRRGAVWGVGYYGLKGELDRVRKLFDDEELRSDALFAYALAIPSEVSRGRMKGLLARIEKDARGLSEMEEQLVKAALDERLVLAGKEPFFTQQED